MSEKLRVVLLYSSGHIGSAVILNRLKDMAECDIVGIIRSPAVSGNFEIRENLKKFGWRFSWLLVWQRAVQGLFYGVSILLRPWLWKKTLLPAWYVARLGGIPVMATRKVNGDACEGFIRSCKPDIIVSAYFNRILKPNIIAIPPRGILNIHPGWLPAYKGVMSYFWVLRNNDTHAGVTLHWIDEGIDTGAIVARRRFPVRHDTTQHIVLLKTAVMGAYMLRTAFRRMLRGEDMPVIERTTADENEAYYPMPQEQAFDDYYSRRRFFRVRDMLFGTLRGLKKWFQP